MKYVRSLIIGGRGLNCERETEHVFKQAGAKPEIVHLDDLLQMKTWEFENYQILVCPGGFSYGDEIAAGKILAGEIDGKIGDAIYQFIKDDEKLVLGICNGAQAFIKMGLAPALDEKYGLQTATLTVNDSGEFVDRWTTVEINPESPCVFTKGIDKIRLPIRHGEGKFAFGEGVYDEVKKKHLDFARYVDEDAGRFPHFANKPYGDMAGLCDESGRVALMMPHPEGNQFAGQDPRWYDEDKEVLRRTKQPVNAKAPGAGLKIIQNGVDYAAEVLV